VELVVSSPPFEATGASVEWEKLRELGFFSLRRRGIYALLTGGYKYLTVGVKKAEPDLSLWC